MKQQYSDFEFWPKAMLPAWVVTDEDLIVQKSNDFAKQLLGAVGKDRLFFNRLLSLRLNNLPTNGHESLWKCILDPKYQDNFEYVGEALRILHAHVDILNGFNGDGELYTADSLVEQLNQATAEPKLKEAVVPYVIRPLATVERLEFVMGVKVSPPQGLKLISPVNLEDSVVEYVDIVMAYRLKSEWGSDRKLRRLNFVGTQTAIHDATARHSLWEKTEAEKRARVTQFLSHAFQTPVSNIASVVRELQHAELSEYYKSRLERLLTYVDELDHLSSLLVFISTSDSVPTTLCGQRTTERTIWETVSIEEIKTVIANTLRSVLSGRTRNPQNETKVRLLIENGATSTAVVSSDPIPLANYENAAHSIVDLTRLDGPSTFGVLLPEGSSYQVAEKIKTTFLNLLLVEMLLNAIKCADPHAPEVKLLLTVDSARHHLDIGVINNKTTLTERELNMEELSEVVEKLERKHGEKRTALGMKLNMIAAKKLDWQLRCKKLDHPGTHLVLSIPFRD